MTVSVDPDRAIEKTRTFIDSCMADPDLHDLLGGRKASLLAGLTAMARAQREKGRTDAAWYVEDMITRLKHWQYEDDC